LEARAQFDAPERSIHARVAAHADRLYLDLADEHWRAVEIGTEGWRAIEVPPLRFRRSQGHLGENGAKIIAADHRGIACSM